MVSPEDEAAVLESATAHGVPAARVGAIGGASLKVEGTTLDMSLDALTAAYNAHHITAKKAG